MTLKKFFSSGHVQLDIIGVGLLVILGLSAWHIARGFTWYSVLPLIFIFYAAFRIVFELTINRANVPTLATGFAGRGKIADILKREASLRMDRGYTVIDLGSGRGELTRHIAKTIPTARVIGIELARIPYLQSSWMQRWLGPKNLSYQRCDFWPYDCSEIDAVVFYLSRPFAERAGEKLYRELKPGGTVISHTFPLLAPWEPVEVVQFRTPFKEVIYVYRKA
ncbi:MAG: class I SAM-dependent methyltransferase [Alphaproteobacteria bacterium]|nr:class I SAM-dependent methyltransferase [Alphaproteobacteria bacterium]